MELHKRKPSIVYWLDNRLYLNLTNKCSNNCYFCLKKFKNGLGEFNLKLGKNPTAEEVVKELQKVIINKKWKEVVFCGFGEPLVRLDVVLEITRIGRFSFG